ncbi:MAG: glycosyltransferase family 4 protein [Candidatus Helarchaeota archaeon]
MIIPEVKTLEEILNSHLFVLAQKLIEYTPITINWVSPIKNPENLSFNRVNLYKIPTLNISRIQTLSNFYYLRKRLSKIKDDVCLASAIIPALSGIYSKKKTIAYIIEEKSRFKLTNKGSLLVKTYIPLFREMEYHMIRKAHIIAVTNKSLLPWLKKIVPNKKIFHIPWGINTDFYNPKQNSSKLQNLKNELGNEIMDKKIMMYTGGAMPGHGVDFLIRAFGLLKKEYEEYENNLILLLVGPVLRDDLLEIVKESGLKLNKDIKFLGWQDFRKIPLFHQLADVLIVPARPLSRALMGQAKIGEYLSSGRPILTSGVDVASDLTHNIHVCKFKTSSYRDFVNKAIYLLKNDDYRLELSKNARKYAEKYLNYEKIAKKFEKIVEFCRNYH